MLLPPRYPNPTESILDWAREMTRYVRANTPLQGKGTRLNRTPNGTRIEATATAVMSGSSTADTGCFRIVGIDGLDVTFANCYLTVGGKFHDIGEVPEDEDEPQIAVATVTLESDNPFLVIQLDAQSGEFAYEFAQFETSADLESDCEDPAHFNLPLYEFNIVETEEGSGEYTVSVKADLRNIPTAPMMEI